jgi:hypothetical protein
VIALVIEMFRDGEWEEVHTPPDVRVAALVDGGPTIYVRQGHIQPPWRVRLGEEILFERAQ